MNFVIENLGEIKEAFSYERSLNEYSQHALLEYARANYGSAALVRPMTATEEDEYANGSHLRAAGRR
jgi:hypothetical protein